MDKIVEELKGAAVAALCAGVLLAFIFGLFNLAGGAAGGGLAEAAKVFVRSIGG